MECPKCGGPMWDNRQTKKSPKMPDYKCKDRENCDGVIWPPRNKGNGGGNAQARSGAGGGNSAGTQRVSRPLGPLYYECLGVTVKSLKKLVPDAKPEDIIAATATLFIGATNTGFPILEAPKPTPSPRNDWEVGANELE